MSALFAQVSIPSEGLDSGLYMPLWLVLVLYIVLFVAGRVLDGREDDRSETVQDAGFALLLLAGVYVAILAVYAIFSEFALIADAVEIMAIIIAFMGVLVTFLLLVELAFAAAGKGRRRGATVPTADGDDEG